jgi:hypothetical protein
VLHFTEIFDKQILDLDDVSSAASKSIMAFKMQMHNVDEEKNDEFVNEPSMPLYSLGIGISASSEGIPCANAAGISGSAPDYSPHGAPSRLVYGGAIKGSARGNRGAACQKFVPQG